MRPTLNYWQAKAELSLNLWRKSLENKNEELAEKNLTRYIKATYQAYLLERGN